MPEVEAKLAAGAEVADVGGRSSSWRRHIPARDVGYDVFGPHHRAGDG
jgi:hypothetical protein